MGLICNRAHSLPYLSILSRALFGTRTAADIPQYSTGDKGRCCRLVSFFPLFHIWLQSISSSPLMTVNSPNTSEKERDPPVRKGHTSKGGFPKGLLIYSFPLFHFVLSLVLYVTVRRHNLLKIEPSVDMEVHSRSQYKALYD